MAHAPSTGAADAGPEHVTIEAATMAANAVILRSAICSPSGVAHLDSTGPDPPLKNARLEALRIWGDQGFCCTIFPKLRGIRQRGSTYLSGSDFEQRGDDPFLALDVVTIDIPNLPLPDHCHRFIACQRSSGCPEVAKSKPWTGQSFHVPMILLSNVVQVFDLAQP